MHRNEVQSRQVPARHPPHKYQVRIQCEFDVFDSMCLIRCFKKYSNVVLVHYSMFRLCRCDGLLLLQIYFKPIRL